MALGGRRPVCGLLAQEALDCDQRRPAIDLAEDLYRQICARLKKRRFKIVGEIGFVDGLRFVALYGDGGRMSGVYWV
jgi:hypothetical protein